MNGSGLLFSDLAMVCFFLYVFNGGWLATLLGMGFCIIGWRARARWLSLVIGIACLAPVGYIFMLSLAAAHTFVATSDPASLIGIAGFAMSVLAAPIAAFITLRRGARP